jgi:hypothetical protein
MVREQLRSTAAGEAEAEAEGPPGLANQVEGGLLCNGG